jgi:antitoxin Phd
VVWSLQNAKARFSELVNRALAEGPQTVSRHGQPVVVLVPLAEFARFTRRAGSLSSFFLSAPRAELEVVRTLDPKREVRL